jgi:DNA-binding response OmpR family regulator
MLLGVPSGNRGLRMSEKCILLVEDERDIQDILSYTLRRKGYTVDVAATVAEAQTRLQATSYALVITDWRLPDGDGTIVADWASEMGAKTFVISGYLFEMPGGRALGHETLMKPVNPNDLVDIVEQSIGKAGI